MLQKIYKAVASTAVVGIVFASAAVSPLFAETPQMTSASQAAATNAWTELEPGASHTVQIKYDAFEKDGRLASEAIAELEMGKAGSVVFDVYTATQYKDFVAGKDVDPVGRGNLKSEQTGNSHHDTKLLWANRTNTSDTFYVRVINKSAGVSSYHLSISGNGTTIQGESGIALQETAAQEAAAPAPAQSVARSAIAEVKAAPVDTVTADGPDSAISVGSNTGVLAAGETRWYTFKYDYDHSGNKSPKQAIVELKMNEEESVAFDIWTPAQVRDWANGEKVKAVGGGSVSKNSDTTLVWVGSARATDQYYVLVENQTNSPATYSIDISGSTVSFR